jgi:cell division protein FtsN
LAFVLLLLSLAASFAFGLMIGKGQADERLVVRKETPVVTEGALVPGKTKSDGRIVELGVEDDDFRSDTAEPAAEPAATTTDTPPVTTATVIETPATDAATPAVIEPAPAAVTTPPPPAATPAKPGVTTYAQLLSTGDQKTAEALAARLIDRGFNSAYVERGSSEKGATYRVRVKFASEAEARSAESRLHEFSKDVWITAK